MVEKPRVRNIIELARIAGVSPGTVSRALSGTGMISQKTRERIKALAREHDFRPNVMARNLRIQRTGAIGVVVPLGHETSQHISDPFFISMLGYLADQLTERGYDLMLSRVIPQREDWLDQIIDTGRIDGLILLGQSDQTATLERIAARYLPMVVWGGYRPGQNYCSVGSDNRIGGKLAAAHLIARGCRSIAFFGDPRAVEIVQRFEGVKDALREAGISEQQLSQFPAHLTAEVAQPRIVEWIERTGKLPDGIVAASDVVAMTTIRVLAEHGISVPADIKIIGYDDLPLAQHTMPQLTTIRQNFQAGATHLVDLLLRRIGGEETESVVMTPELVVRAST